MHFLAALHLAFDLQPAQVLNCLGADLVLPYAMIISSLLFPLNPYLL